MISILDACADPNLFGPWFKSRETYEAWFTFFATLFALPMTEAQHAVYVQCTGRPTAPTEPANEAFLVIGRRGGKSFALALLGVYLACFRQYRQHLAPGERATIMVIATDRRQSRIILRYIRALLGIPMLKEMIVREGAEFFDLNNSISIEVMTASFKSTRGYTSAAILCDEVAFWPADDDAAEQDSAILDALRPTLVTIPNSMLLCASSPYAQKGVLYDAHKRHFGKNGDPLVWQAATRVMNPTVPQGIIDAAMERDSASASAEYLAYFRTDVAALLTRAALDACVAPGIHERAPLPRVTYTAFVDPSGGSADSFTLAIAHKEGDTVTLDCIREIKPPFSPEKATKELSEVLDSFGCSDVHGDRYAGEWPRERFAAQGIKYEISERPKSEIYLDVLPLINSRRCELLDDARMLGQFSALERKTARGGRDSIDHRPGAHDDVCNAVAGALVLAENARPPLFISPEFINKLQRLDARRRLGHLH
jgi:terminase large subunit-like protein